MDNAFLEQYIHLEKLCNDLYGNSKGITNYIDDLESLSNCINIPESVFYDTCKKLKELRWKRNQYAHEGVVKYNQADTEWLSYFYQTILAGKDPLTLIRKSQGKYIIQHSATGISGNNENQGVVEENDTKISTVLIIIVVLVAIEITLGICLAVFYLPR